MRNWNILLGLGIAAALAQGCSGATRGEGDSETHWACANDDECPGSMVCVAERCESSSGGSSGTRDPSWSCLGSGVPPITRVGATQFQLKSILGSGPVEGAEAKLCRGIDVECTEPIGVSAFSDADGFVTLDPPENFTGYAEFTSSGNLPTLYLFNPRTRRTDYVAQIASSQTMAALSQAVGNPQKDGNGFSLVSVRDCTGALASGVRLEFDGIPDASVFYAVSSLPSADATATDSSGYGGLVNMPPGIVMVRAVRASTSERIGEVAVLVRPDAFSYTEIAPDDS